MLALSSLKQRRNDEVKRGETRVVYVFDHEIIHVLLNSSMRYHCGYPYVVMNFRR